jgi:hypothetical protein
MANRKTKTFNSRTLALRISTIRWLIPFSKPSISEALLLDVTSPKR